MGFNPMFYAGRPKLSEVTIDSDLNMGGRDISGVDTLRAGQVYAPYRPEPWPTDTLDWCDTEAADIPTTATGGILLGGYETIFEFNSAGDSTRFYRYALNITAPTANSATTWYFQLAENGVVTYTSSDVNSGTGLAVDLSIRGGAHVTGQMFHPGPANTLLNLHGATLHNTGYAVGMALTNAWLALGLDMLALDVTVKIQGVEMPYSDYMKYFPLAPTELHLPASWTAPQARPVIEVYV